MKDLSLHLLDILENSAKAGAAHAELEISWSGTWLAVSISDDGPGLPPEISEDPTDPFRTTRRDRPAGLGLSLLRTAAEQTGGTLRIESTPGAGTRLEVRVDLNHVDAKPLGDVTDALLAAAAAWPELSLTVRLSAPERREVLDTATVKAELDGVPLGHPEVQRFLRTILREEFADLTAWADAAMLGGAPDARQTRDGFSA